MSVLSSAEDARPAPEGSLPLRWIIFWAVVGALAVAYSRFQIDQDIRSYSENLMRRNVFGDLVTDQHKALWYRFVAYPLLNRLHSLDATFAVIRAVIGASFVLGLWRYLRSHFDAVLLLVILVFTPALSENFNEYLRQGMAIGCLLIAVSVRNWPARVALAVLALAAHTSVGVLILALVGGWVGAAMVFPKASPEAPFALNPGWIVALAAAALALGAVGAGVLRQLPIAELRNFLGGNRSNVLAIAFLAGYAIYVGYQASRHRSVEHVAAFMGILFVCITYSLIKDFGRSISLVLPLHLRAALALPAGPARVLDLGAVVVAGTLYIFA